MTRAITRERTVWVRSPHASELREALTGQGGRVTTVEPGLLRVTGLTAAEIGDLAVEWGAPIHELRTQAACRVTTGRARRPAE